MSVLDSYRPKFKFRVGDRGVTAEGQPYRVICVDKVASHCPIVALITFAFAVGAPYEEADEFFPDGQGSNSGIDLLPPTERGPPPLVTIENGPLSLTWVDIASLVPQTVAGAQRAASIRKALEALGL